MKVTHYFLHFSYNTKAKNILQEELEAYLKALNGKLITEFELSALKASIEQQIAKLNAKFVRCNPILFRFYENNRTIHIHGTHVKFAIIPASFTKVDNLKKVEL